MNTSEALRGKQPAIATHPYRLVLFLLMISIFMIFAAYTSAYIVRREEGNWLEFALPNSLLLNTVILVLSSVAMQWGYSAARRDSLRQVQLGVGAALLLGVAFLFGQWHVWSQLVDNKIFFGGTDANPSGSFVYVLTGVHGFHLITGLIFLAIVLRRSFRFEVHSRQMLSIGNATIYWHYLTALWLYLYLFLLLNN